MNGTDAIGRPTHPQTLIWAGQALQPASPLYNMVLTFELTGSLDPDRFEAAFQSVVDRSDALRTVFEVHEGSARTRVRDSLQPPSIRVDFSDDPAPELAARRWVAEAAERGFDLSSQLFESALLRLSDDRHLWFLNQHHLITDAWSTGLVFRYTAESYARLAEKSQDDQPPLPAYQDFGSYLADFAGSRAHTAAIGHWNKVKSGHLGPTALYGRAPAVGSSAGSRTERLTLNLGTDRSRRIRELAGLPAARGLTEHASRFNVFAALVLGFMARVSGQERLSLSAPSHNRSTHALKDTIGLFIEMYPLAVEVDPETRFIDLMSRVQKEALSFLRYAQPGTSDGVLNRSTNVVLNYINASFSDFAGLPTRSEWVHAGYGDSGHDLRVQVHDFDGQDELVVHMDLSTERFEPQERERSARHFLNFVDAALHAPESRLGALNLSDEEEISTLRGELGRSDSGPMPPEGRTSTVIDAFRERWAAQPEAIAIVSGDSLRWTYDELRRRSLAVAHELERIGVAGRTVLLSAPRSAEAVAGLLGILEAGGAYVPVDPETPPDRFSFLVETANPAAIVTALPGAAPVTLPTVPLGPPPLTPTQMRAWDAENGKRRPQELAYVLFTSGSSGEPKGVKVTHGSLANYATWAADAYLGADPATMALFTPLTFDLTVTSIFAPLVSGKTIRVYEDGGEAVDTSVINVFADDSSHVVKLTPSHLALVVERAERLETIRTLVVGGEELTTPLARAARALLAANGRVINEYGPTETTVACTVHEFDPTRDTRPTVPIGRPMAGARVAIVEPAGQLAPLGVVGEIWVGGPGVAQGYLARPTDSAARFVRDPLEADAIAYKTGDLGRWASDGVLEYHGRLDRQVKIHGVRVEPAEVEAAISSHPSVLNSVVLSVSDRLVGLPLRDAGNDQRTCIRCGIGSSHPEAQLDASGVCSLCSAYDGYGDRAAEYFGSMDELRDLLHARADARNGAYDCLMLLSGGKDSSYALYRLVEMGLSVLTITLDNGYISDGAKANIRRIAADLDVPHEFVTSESMNQVFVDSLERFSNVCQGCFKTMYTLAFNIALERDIPSIVTGLSRGQFFETRLTEELFIDSAPSKKSLELVVLDARKAYHRAPDFVNRTLDTSNLRDDEAFERVAFVDFYRYCDVELSEMLDYLGEHASWIRPADTGRSTNCLINDVGIFVHKKERGFHNYALPYSWDVRLGHKTRDAALEELDDAIDEARVQQILDEIGYSPQPLARTANDDRRLVAIVSGAAETGPDELRGFLKTRLPSFMIPSRFVFVDEIPMTARGKVDTAALEAIAARAVQPKSAATGVDHPVTPTERRLVTLWAEALRLEGVGTDANFFDVGGDSITAIRVAARALAAGVQITPNDLFRHQTIRDLARVADERMSRPAPSDESTPETASADALDTRTLDQVAALLRRADGT